MNTTNARTTMTISYQTQGGYVYGTVCTVRREGKKVVKDYGASLGRLIDKDRLVFYTRERGLYVYDPVNDAYLPPPDDVEPPKRKSRLKVPARVVSLTFGDVYLVDQFARSLQFYDVLSNAYADRIDSVKALMSFYILTPLSNRYAGDWLEHSFGRFLFPDARLSSSTTSKVLKYVGEPSRQRQFFADYFAWFKNTFQDSDLGNILIDSTGLPNSIHFSLTAVSNHNGDINNEVRLIYVVQQSTGMPIFFRAIPGNIIDVNTLKRTLLELKANGIDTNYAITDAGYLSEENVHAFYSSGVSFLVRLQPNRKLYKQLIAEHLPSIKTEGKLVKQRERLIRVKKVACCLNEKTTPKGRIVEKGYPAYAYVCVDEQRVALEQLDLIKKVAEGKVDVDNYEKTLAEKGVFVLVSKRSIDPGKVIELYYTRQEIEQVFDLGKNYSGMLPLSIQTEETFRGHMVLTFMATILIKALMKKLSGTHYPIEPTLSNLAAHSCSVYDDYVITSEPNKLARQAYQAAGIEYPIQVFIK